MYYPQEIVDQVIEANNIVDVIGSYVKLTKKGSTYFGLCPFHNEKTPSFSVTDNGNKQMYYCFGCHKGGSVLTFLMQYENASYTDALRQLADRAGIVLPQQDFSRAESLKAKRKEEILAVNKDAALYFYKLLKSPRGAQAYRYLKDRGLSDETIKNFGLGYSDKYRDDLYQFMKQRGYSDEILKASGLFSIRETRTGDYFWNRVMFPIMDVRSRVIAFGGRVMGDGEPKYLNSPETECFNKRNTLYGLHVAKKHKGKELILAEGYMDVIALHQAGFTNAVASLGTALTDSHAALLKRFTDRVVISYDSDTAGQDAALRAIPKLKAAGLNVKVANLIPYKDPDELIRAEGESAYRDRLNRAQNSILFEILCLRASYDMTDPDDKTRFYHETAKRLSFLTDHMEQENYIQAVADEFQIDHALLRERTRKYALSHDTTKTYEPQPVLQVRKKDDQEALKACQSMLLSFLAEEPSLYDTVGQWIDEHDFFLAPYDRIAQLLFAQIAKGVVKPASIISSFEEPQEQEEAAAILDRRTDKEMEKEDRLRAINECVIRLKKSSLARQIDAEQDLSRVIALKKEEEQIQKVDIFGRKN